MQFRFGVNLGDIVVDEAGDVFGDGVNVAARVEALADPGGITVTDAVAGAIRGKVDVRLVDVGPQELKNIPVPVRLWKVVYEGNPPGDTPSIVSSRKLATVVVLPFDNLSGDIEQEYFADGITEDLITALSRDRDLAVVARNSTFAFKGSPTDIRTIARELDATHLIEGSVRKSGVRVRVTAQLIDAESGHHLWAERYDRDLHDIFEVQDEVVESIVTRLRPAFWDPSDRRVRSRDHRSFDAWDLTLQGQFHANSNTIDGFVRAIDFYDRARALEPSFVAAISRSAGAWLTLWIYGWRNETINPVERAQDDLRLALSLEPDNHLALCIEGAFAGVDGRPEDGVAVTRRAIEINPHVSLGHHMLGTNLDKAGDQQGAIAALTEAWRLGTHEPLRYDIASDLGYAHSMSANDEAALQWGRQSLRLVDGFLQSRLLMAATCSRLGLDDEAAEHVGWILDARPDFSCDRFASRFGYRKIENRDRFVEGLRKAGLPG